MKTLKPGNKQAVFVDCERTLYVDVDETLVLTKWPESLDKNTIVIDHFGHDIRVWPHLPHAEAIRQFKARGHAVVVWSAGGARWAKAVVEAMGLTDAVDVIISKPDWLIDDKPVSAWMGDRFYWDVDGTVLADDRDTNKGGE